jgi:ABC-type branched-subunit amino acid transport system ATPase component
MIALESVYKRFGGVTALDGVSAEFRSDRRCALVGPTDAVRPRF